MLEMGLRFGGTEERPNKQTESSAPFFQNNMQVSNKLWV